MDNGSNISDMTTLNFRNPTPDAGPVTSNFSIPVSDNSNMIRTSFGRVFTSPPPPVPARPSQNNFNGGFNSFSSPFGGYGPYSSQINNGFGAFGGYGGFGGYGQPGYRSGLAPFGYGSGGYYYPENRFIQMAEESSRPVLDSIQSLLQAFSSVTMMFESSFQAIYSSYMSVVGVAANFCRIRSLLEQFFSGFAFFKTLNVIYRYILYTLGIKSQDYLKETAWSDAFNKVTNKNQPRNQENKKQILPFFVIMGIVLGGPYLLFKLMSKMHPNAMPGIWEPNKCPGTVALCVYDFIAGSDQELSFKAHQKLMIAPDQYQPLDCPGWLLACNSELIAGLVPSNYLGFFVQSEKGEVLVEYNGQRFKYVGKNSVNRSAPRTKKNDNNTSSTPANNKDSASANPNNKDSASANPVDNKDSASANPVDNKDSASANPVDNKDSVKIVNQENKKEDEVKVINKEEKENEKQKTVSGDEGMVINKTNDK